MARKMMPHQVDGARYLRQNGGGALFWEMRTGKTLPTIRFARSVKPREDTLRAIVVAPNSALGSWERELRLEGEEDVAYLQGPRKKRLEALAEDHRWTLANKEAWLSVPEIGNRVKCAPCKGRGKRDEKRCGHCHGRGWLASDDPRCWWDVVILDESTFVKGPRARVTKFFTTGFRDVPHRVILTGMPNPESELDLYSQLAFLRARPFGCESYWAFRARYFEQEMYGHDWFPRAGTAEMMERHLAARTSRLRRRDADMPDRVVRETRDLTMPKDLRETYERAEEDFDLTYRDREITSTIYAGARWQWMRQMCGGFVDGEVVWPGKLDEVRALLRGELAREQVVVWFAYNQELKAAHERLPGSEMIYGDVPPPERRRIEERFRTGATRVLLLQQKVAEFGMDLSVADTAIFYSRHPGLLTNGQSEDRIVHPKKTWPLLLVDLTVKDSVDEDVASALREKRWRSQRLLDAAVMGRFNARRET